jgi:hypothetical protein
MGNICAKEDAFTLLSVTIVRVCYPNSIKQARPLGGLQHSINIWLWFWQQEGYEICTDRQTETIHDLVLL